MKQDFPQYGIAVLCGLFGKTRHAYYDALWRKEGNLVKEDVILQEIIEIRKDLPRLGTRKLHHVLQKNWQPMKYASEGTICLIYYQNIDY